MNTQDKLNIIFSRMIVIFGGEYGRCKSLSLSALTFFEILHTQKTKVISNMPLYYPVFKNVEIEPLIQTSQFDLKNLEKIKHSIVIHDEIFNDLFSRSFATEKNKFIPNMAVGFRKDNIRYRCSLQFFDTLEMLLGLMLEMQIIPSFVRKYSEDSDKDREIRLENHDFWVNWKCIDKKANNIFEVQINLYPFMKFYNTWYKPYTLSVNHESFLEKLHKNKKTYYDDYMERLPLEISENIKHWNEGLEEIKENFKK